MVEVYQHDKSPFWYYDMIDPRTKKRVRKSTKRTKKGEAIKVAENALKEALDRAQLGVIDEITLETAVTDYIATLQGRASHHGSQLMANKLFGRLKDRDGNPVRRFFLEPTMKLHDLTKRVLTTLRTKRTTEGNSIQTINHEVKLLRASWRLAQSHKYRVDTSVEFDLPKPPVKTRHLSEDEEAKLVAYLDPSRPIVGTKGTVKGKEWLAAGRQKAQRQDAYDLAVMLLDTGARYSEIAKLTWDCVDTQSWEWVRPDRVKGGEDNAVAMTRRLREVLQRRFAEKRNSLYVFPSWDFGADEDKPRGHSTAAIRRAMNRLGFNAKHLVAKHGRCNAHTLRHTYASRLGQHARMSLAEIGEMLRHKSPEMTKRYVHFVTTRTAKAAADALDKLHGNGEART